MSDVKNERGWMERAIACARESVSEDRRPGTGLAVAPAVGAVIVTNGQLLAEAHRGQTGDGDHAEYGALTQVAADDLRGAVVFTTLEPCTERPSQHKIPCTKRLIDSNVATVYIGSYDPNPRINRIGWRALIDAGIEVRDFDADLRQQIEDLNRPFIEQFRTGLGDLGTSTFDYEQNGGEFEVVTSLGAIVTKWSRAGVGSIHAYGQPHPGLAKQAPSFDSIDDASAYDFSRQSVTVREGEIAIFRSGDDSACLLVEVISVASGPDYGFDHTSVTIRWQARPNGRRLNRP